MFTKAASRRRGRKEHEGEDEEEAGGVALAARATKRGLMASEKAVGGGVAVTVAADAKDDEEERGGALQQVADGEKVYAGEKARANFFKTSDGRVKGTAGLRAAPVKASNFIRSTTTIDYNPSVCKDYKQTGSCDFGQNCIYVHDRGDYKSGWEIDKEWAARGAQEENFEIHSSDDGEDELPVACFICRGEFVQPVVTKCGHRFCESCALQQEKKTKRCAICNEPTSGIFNEPKALYEKIAAK
jgi:RING finger protein 113A